MCYEKSVNIFEQNMRERARWAKTTMRVCGKGVAARIARQKAPVIKENAKYSFVELGKLNTSLYTRRILKRFRRLHRQCPHSLVLSQFEPFSVASALILHDHHSWPTRILYNHRKGRQLSSSLALPFALWLSLSPQICALSYKRQAEPAPASPVTKTQSTALNPFRGLRSSLHGISVRFHSVCVCSPFQQLSAVDVFCSSSQSRCL